MALSWGDKLSRTRFLRRVESFKRPGPQRVFPLASPPRIQREGVGQGQGLRGAEAVRRGRVLRCGGLDELDGLGGGHGAIGGGGDELPEGLDAAVAGNEDAGGGRMAVLARDDAAGGVKRDQVAERGGLRSASDGDEEAADLERAHGAILHVLDLDGEEVLLGDEAYGDGVEDELDVGLFAQAGDGGLFGPEGVAAVDEEDLVDEVGEVERVLERGIAAAHDGDGLLAIEGPVAGGAVGDAAADELVLLGKPELAVARADGKNHGAAFVAAFFGDDDLHAALVVDLDGPLEDNFGPEPARLCLDARGEVVARQVRLDGVVLDVRCVDDLSAADQRLEHKDGARGAPGVDGGGEAGGATADDDDVVHGDYLWAASSFSISGASAAGSEVGWQRCTTLPERSTRNLVKFHSMSPGASAPFMPCWARSLRNFSISSFGPSSSGMAALRNTKSGSASGPFTSVLASWSNCVL